MKRRSSVCVLAFIAGLLLGYPVLAYAEVPHHDAEVIYDPGSRRLVVKDRITIQPTDEIQVVLAAWIRIDRAVSDDRPLLVEKANGYWRIVSQDGLVTQVTIDLSGSVPAMPPMEARRGVRGASADPEEGGFLPGYFAWMPDTGADHVTYRLQVRIPGVQRAVATGRIISETQSGNGYEGVFEADYPSELPSLFFGPYSVTERVIDGIRIRTYFHEEINEYANHYINQSAAYISMFADKVGPYPFDDFHIVSAPLPVGLGFPNMTYIGRTIVPLPFMRGRSLAHEVMHNWWGNGVAVDYWSGNWAEGLTTYFADYGLALGNSPDAAREMRLAWLRDYAALPESEDSPVASFVSKTHQASQVIGYNKAAHIFHMLRLEVGDAAFDKAIRDFWTAQRFKTAGWKDIQNAFEMASDRELGWFFDQWIVQSGAPKLEIVEAKVRRKDGGFTVSVTLRQNNASFRILVPVIVETEKGPVRTAMTLLNSQGTIEIPVDSAPTYVKVDSDYDVFRQLLPGESPPIMRDITLAPKVDVMILASDDEYKSSALALAKRLSNEVIVVKEGAPERATIVIGTGDRISEYAKTSLSKTLPEIVRDDSAAAWSDRDGEGWPVLFVRADNSTAVQNLMRPLPHYGSRSYVTFDGSRALQKGVWSVEDTPLSRELNSVEP